MVSFFTGLIQAAAQGGVAAIESYIISQPSISFLEGPVLDAFTNAAIEAFVTSLSGGLQNVVTAVIIDLQTKGEASDVAAAVQELNAATDPDSYSRAQENFQKAISALVRWDLGPRFLSWATRVHQRGNPQ